MILKISNDKKTVIEEGFKKITSLATPNTCLAVLR
jgi:hypothetical protein